MFFKNCHVGSCEVIKINSHPVLPGNIKMWDHNITFKKPPKDPKISGSHKNGYLHHKKKMLKQTNQNSQTKPNQTKIPTLSDQKRCCEFGTITGKHYLNLMGDPSKA